MTRKTRLIVLLVCVVLFLIITPYIVLHSLGYRVDFKKLKVVQTGGIFVKAEPQGADIIIDSQTNTTGFFNNSVFVQNLLPGTYQVTIKKTGYYDYQKTLDVAEGQVTKLEHVLLIKQQIVFTTAPDTVPFPLPAIQPISPDGQKIISCNNHEISYSFANTPQNTVFLNRFSKTLTDCQWLTNDYVIFNLGGNITISEIDTRGNINIVSLPNPLPAGAKLYFNQQDKQLYVLNGEILTVSERLIP